MAENGFIRDPVQGLEDFVNDIKPYHTKVIDVLVEYIYQDEMVVSIAEETKCVKHLEINNTDSGCPDGFATGPFDVLSGNIIPGIDIQSVDLGNNRFILSSSSGDVTDQFPTGKETEVSDSPGNINDGIYTVNFSTFNGSETEVTMNVLDVIPSSTAGGELSPYVYDNITNLPISNFDTELSNCSTFGAFGDTVAATTFEETFIITVIDSPGFGGEWDSMESEGFDPIGEGYDF